jgi:hypothetical protein
LRAAGQELNVQAGIKFSRYDGEHSENVLTQLGVAGRGKRAEKFNQHSVEFWKEVRG